MSRPNVFVCEKVFSTKRKYFKKWIKRFVKYYRKPSNEFCFFVCSLHRKFTNLPANLYFDDGGLWTNLGNKKIILFQINNHDDRDFDKTIPMSIEDKPEILNPYHEKIALSDFELEQIKDFASKCQEELILIGDDQKINHTEFFERINRKGFHAL